MTSLRTRKHNLLFLAPIGSLNGLVNTGNEEKKLLAIPARLPFWVWNLDLQLPSAILGNFLSKMTLSAATKDFKKFNFRDFMKFMMFKL